MQNEKNQQRINLLQELSTDLNGLYTSVGAGDFYRSIFEKNNLADTKYPVYIETVGDTILGIYKVSELPQKLQENVGLDEGTATAITSELIEFLTPVIEAEKNGREPVIFTPTIDTVSVENSPQPTTVAETVVPEETPAATASVEVISTPEATSGPATPEAEAVKPLRTMAEDMKIVHGYGAYRDENPLPEEHSAEEPVHSTNQDETLQERPSLVNKPNYTSE